MSQRRSARLASSRELAVRADSILTRDSELALLLALQAVDNAPTVEAETVLHRALHGARLRRRFDDPERPVEVDFSDGGERLYTAFIDGTVSVRDVSSGEQLVRVGDAGRWAAATFAIDPHRARVVTWGRASSLLVWDAVTGDALATLSGHSEGRIDDMAFSPDGSWLASAGRDGVRLWNTATWSERARLTGHDRSLARLAFDGAGSRLATAGHDNLVKLWDVATATELVTLRGHRRSSGRCSSAPTAHKW